MFDIAARPGSRRDRPHVSGQLRFGFAVSVRKRVEVKGRLRGGTMGGVNAGKLANGQQSVVVDDGAFGPHAAQRRAKPRSPPSLAIALSFHPYNRCELWPCRQCAHPFLLCTEYGDYDVDRRIRTLNSALIF
jgi:hypothetical protein